MVWKIFKINKTLQWRHWRRSGVLIVYFKHYYYKSGHVFVCRDHDHIQNTPKPKNLKQLCEKVLKDNTVVEVLGKAKELLKNIGLFYKQ